ncbi:MAG: type IV toxin-antitoxin system AbiEi family antitoxin domain-containing protein [Betaproteobacteria bacterium]
MVGMRARQLARLARGQRGLFTRADARRCGFSDGQIRRRIAAGEWRGVVGSVSTVGSARLSQAQLDLAVQLAVPGSVLTGPAAAREWGMPVDDDRIMLVVGSRRLVRVPGVLVVYGSLGPREVVLSDGARVTRRERARSSTACGFSPSDRGSTSSSALGDSAG